MSGLLLKVATRPRMVAAGVGLFLLLSVAVQSARLSHAKADLHEARAASRDPATGRAWRSEALAAKWALTSCADQRDQVAEALRT